MPDYDVIVIGGGSAGTSAAAAASRSGARTLMINEGELGGLCILRGCMPTKAMLASAHALAELRHLEGFGIRLDGEARPDFARIMARKDAQVRRFQSAKISSIERQDYEVTFGRARFVPGGALEVDGRRVEGSSYVIATGSTPRMFPIPGAADVPVWSSDDVMRASQPPRALLVQGAGPIGLELAQFFARIGTRVLLVNRSPLLSHHDVECGDELRRALLEEANLCVMAPATISRVAPRGGGLEASLLGEEGEMRFEADALLMATGRRPALDDLGLEHVGLSAERGRLKHDTRMRTASERVFVAGDATGTSQVLHLANQEGTVAGHNAAGGEPPQEMDYRLKMNVIFTDPPFAAVGATGVELASRGIDAVTGLARFAETGRAITMNVRHGLWKMWADRSSGEILGSAVLGPRADDLIHIVSTAMHFRANADEICSLPWYHPTLSEVILNLGRDIASGRHVPCSVPGAATLPPGYSMPDRASSEAEAD
jgi:pyruvate/2-oxoglutarate dehydrogenase complex dihydrolipoamide dehydrogenase (E3) component